MKSERSELAYNLFFSLLLLIIIALIFIFPTTGSDSMNLLVHPHYLILTLVGVLFHMVSKYRQFRSTGSFDCKTYWFDYVFRAFQAIVYVIIIDNLARTSGTFSSPFSLVALLVGMYIRRVEQAFENLGDRFGDMLKGMLGVSYRKISTRPQQQAMQSFLDEYTQVLENYHTVLPNADDKIRTETEAGLKQVKNLFTQGKWEEALNQLGLIQMELTDLKTREASG